MDPVRNTSTPSPARPESEATTLAIVTPGSIRATKGLPTIPSGQVPATITDESEEDHTPRAAPPMAHPLPVNVTLPSQARTATGSTVLDVRRITNTPSPIRMSSYDEQATARSSQHLLGPRDERQEPLSALGHGPYEVVTPRSSIPARPLRTISHHGRPRERERSIHDRPGSFYQGNNNPDMPVNVHMSRRSQLDWIVPQQDNPRTGREKSVAERLTPTLEHSKQELVACSRRARLTGYALNVAIGMQVILGAITTGVAAATQGRVASIGISVVGGLSTIAASYLARVRGSGEPERSLIRCKELESFIRELEAFMLDRGHVLTDEFDETIGEYRGRFEMILGNEHDPVEKPPRKEHSEKPHDPV